MDPDHTIYVYGSYHNPFHESFPDQQPSHLPQLNSGGETFIVPGDGWTCVDASTQCAGLPPGHLDGHDFYPNISGGSSAAVNQGNTVVFLSGDSSDGLNNLSETSFHLPQTGPIAYPSTPTPDFLDPITSQAIQPSFTIFTSNGVRHYRCVCGHETRRTGDMRRHHESSKHSHRKHFCSLCERWFTRQDGLLRHRKKMHPGSLVI